MNVKCLGAFGVALLVALLPAGPANAAFLYDWAGSPSVSLADPNGDQVEGSRDILKLWYASDAMNHYFRLDIRTAPVQVAGSFSPGYCVQLAYPALDGGNAADSSYIADGLLNISEIVFSHYTVASAWTVDHVHSYLGDASAPPRVDTTAFGSIAGAASDQSENGGTTLQWLLPKSALAAGPFTAYGAALDIGQPATFDITAGIAVPEPATLSLLGIGLAGLAARRRRRT